MDTNWSWIFLHNCCRILKKKKAYTNLKCIYSIWIIQIEFLDCIFFTIWGVIIIKAMYLHSSYETIMYLCIYMALKRSSVFYQTRSKNQSGVNWSFNTWKQSLFKGDQCLYGSVSNSFSWDFVFIKSHLHSFSQSLFYHCNLQTYYISMMCFLPPQLLRKNKY